MPFGIGPWDIALLLAVSIHATVLAYVYDPRWKALLYAVPVPFTLASLALSLPIGTTHVLGLPLVLLYAHGVRWLNTYARMPIFPSIVVSAMTYCIIGTVLTRHVPTDDVSFWLFLSGVFILAVGLYLGIPYKKEQGHRSLMPIAAKLIVVVCVIMGLITAKRYLQGFMTFFPMVGVVAMYEARHSLWTMGRQIPVLMLTMVPMLAVCRLTQERFGLGLALVLGWAAFLVVLVPLTRNMWSNGQTNTI